MSLFFLRVGLVKLEKFLLGIRRTVKHISTFGGTRTLVQKTGSTYVRTDIMVAKHYKSASW